MNDILQPLTGRLARALQFTLIAELFVAVGIFALATASHRFSLAQSLALSVLPYLALRVLAVGNNFWQTYRHRSPPRLEHQIGFWKTLRLLWGEYYVTLIVYSVLFPFERWLVPMAPLPMVKGSGVPVILVPGFACNRGYFFFFARWLGRRGFGPIYAVSLEPLFGSIKHNAALLARFVEAVCAATGQPKVMLVGHSMGGLTIRAYVHHLDGAQRVARAVTLGTPHHGTVTAEGVRRLGENLREMSRGYTWSESLNALQAQPSPVPITAIISPHDGIVAPQSSSELRYPNAKNIFLPGVGHLEMIMSRRTLEATAAAWSEN